MMSSPCCRARSGYKPGIMENHPETAALCLELLEARRTVLPKRLQDPGPSPAQTQLILQAAASAPDHDRLRPWRFVIVPPQQRQALADVFAASLRQRDPQATEHQMAQAREKAFRAPCLLLAVAQTDAADTGVDAAERLVSAGCAIQNMLLMATALGLGSALTSGKALRSDELRLLFDLQVGEQALCFISIGTVTGARPAPPRPEVGDYVSTLGTRQPASTSGPR